VLPLEPAGGTGHTMQMDNFCYNPGVVQELKSMKTECNGTLHPNRNGVPKTVKDKRLKKGQLIAQHSRPGYVLKWSDKTISP
jgi:hypothetical protein